MAVRKLYGAMGSTSTMRALASLVEHELEFEFVPVDLDAGEHKSAHFLSLSPFAEVPVYQDGDLILFESRAIMRFISHNYHKPGKELIYKLGKLQGIAAGWIDVEDHYFDPPASKLIHELIFKPRFEDLSPDEAVVAEEEAKLAQVLDIYEKRLTGSKYLGGDKFTTADLTHLPNLHYLMQTPLRRLFDDRQHVRAWCDNIMSTPGWVQSIELIEQANMCKQL